MFIKDESKGKVFVSTNGGITFQPLQSIEEIETINVNSSVNGGGTFKLNTKIDEDKLMTLIATDVNNSLNKLKDMFAPIFEHLTYHPRFLINKEKRTVFLQYYDTKVSIKCHEDDKFDWKVGLGLAISKANAINIEKAKAHRNIWFRDKKTHKLEYKKYANWVLTEFYKNDMEDLYNLEQRVKQAEDKEFIEL